MAVNGLLEHAVDWGYTTRISVHTPCGVLVLVQSCMQLLSRPNNLALLGKQSQALCWSCPSYLGAVWVLHAALVHTRHETHVRTFTSLGRAWPQPLTVSIAGTDRMGVCWAMHNNITAARRFGLWAILWLVHIGMQLCACSCCLLASESYLLITAAVLLWL
jgi:hypothetical protein